MWKPSDARRDPLATAWRGLLGGLIEPGSGEDDLRAAGADLVGRYDEGHRAYHDTRHLTEVLAAIERLDPGGARPLARLAAWFHDAVYDPAAATAANEEASAALAETVLPRLGVGAGVTAQVAALVRATATHEPDPALGPDLALLCDADLAILAAPRERYDEYARDVRREYAHVPDEVFTPARAAILQGFLDRDRLYVTDLAHDAYESAARGNVRREIGRLTAPA